MVFNFSRNYPTTRHALKIKKQKKQTYFEKSSLSQEGHFYAK